MYTSVLTAFALFATALAAPFDTIAKRTNDDVVCCTPQGCANGAGIQLLTSDMHLPNRTCTTAQGLFSLPTTGIAFEFYSSLGNFSCYAQNLNANAPSFYAGLAPDGTFTAFQGNSASLFGKCQMTAANAYDVCAPR